MTRVDPSRVREPAAAGDRPAGRGSGHAAGSALARGRERVLLLGLYGLILLSPLALIADVVKAGAQGPAVVFADALGFAALSLLALQVIVSGRWSGVTRAFGLRPVLSLHRQAGATVLVLVVLHVAILILDDHTRLALLNSFSAPPRARAGMIALIGLLVLAASSIWREKLGLSYERWRGLHLVATMVVIAAAFAHVVWVDAYTSVPVVRWSVLGLVLASAVALFWTRIARPFATARTPYRVVAVRRERGDAVTLELAAEGHTGLHFEAGQFARLRADHTIYGMGDHPFSLSSSAHRPDRPAFTVKALGDFSSSLRHIEAGTRVYVDGPHGGDVSDAPTVRGRLLIAAGIGITPALSVIRTAVERREQRPMLLVYGSRTWEDVTFREELHELQRQMPTLGIVHVLSRPEEGWPGERGRVGEQVLRRYAPPDVRRWAALICGPAGMVTDAAATLRALGMPAGAIQAEGFG